MANVPQKDALNCEQGTISVTGLGVVGYITGVTIDGRRPEEFVSVLGGQVRRQSPAEYEWSADAVMLYDSVKDIKALGELKFNIVLEFTNPDTSDSDNISQTVTVIDCKISEESLNFSDSSTQRISGKCKEWTVS